MVTLTKPCWSCSIISVILLSKLIMKSSGSGIRKFRNDKSKSIKQMLFGLTCSDFNKWKGLKALFLSATLFYDLVLLKTPGLKQGIVDHNYVPYQPSNTLRVACLNPHFPSPAKKVKKEGKKVSIWGSRCLGNKKKPNIMQPFFLRHTMQHVYFN